MEPRGTDLRALQDVVLHALSSQAVDGVEWTHHHLFRVHGIESSRQRSRHLSFSPHVQRKHKTQPSTVGSTAADLAPWSVSGKLTPRRPVDHAHALRHFRKRRVCRHAWRVGCFARSEGRQRLASKGKHWYLVSRRENFHRCLPPQGQLVLLSDSRADGEFLLHHFVSQAIRGQRSFVCSILFSACHA